MNDDQPEVNGGPGGGAPWRGLGCPQDSSPSSCECVDDTVTRVRNANRRCHDLEARFYDHLFGIPPMGSQAGIEIAAWERKIGMSLPSVEVALDLGCGTGGLILPLLSAGRIGLGVGLDISREMLRGMFANAGPDIRPVAVQGDMEVLPFREGVFDAVICHAVLHHLADYDRMLAESRRVLKAGGLLLLFGEPTMDGSRLCDAPGRVLWAPFRRLIGSAKKMRFSGLTEAEEAEYRQLLPTAEYAGVVPSRLREEAMRAGFVEMRLRFADTLVPMFGSVVEPLRRRISHPAVQRLILGVRGALGRVDRALEGRLPERWYYGMCMTARKAVERSAEPDPKAETTPW